jgi:hypothetical protein
MNLKLECRTPDSRLFTREEVSKILKDTPKYFADDQSPVVEIWLDGEVIHRTRKLAKVQKAFAALLEDLKKIKE